MRHMRSSERSMRLGCSALSRSMMESTGIGGTDMVMRRARSPPPCGEGLGVGVDVVARDLRKTTTPLPNPPPQGGREQARRATLHYAGTGKLSSGTRGLALVKTRHKFASVGRNWWRWTTM